MFNDLQKAFLDFYELSGDAQTNLMKEVVHRGKTDKRAFESYVKKLPYHPDSPISIIYEALWIEPKGWDSLILGELGKWLEQLGKGNRQVIQDTALIMYLTDIEDLSRSTYQKMLDLLFQYLKHPDAAVRVHLVEPIFDVVSNSGIHLNAAQIQELQHLLRGKSFKLRIYTYSNLKEQGLLPKGFQLSLRDKFLAKITGYKEMIQ